MINRDLVTIEIPRNGIYSQDWQMNARSEDGKSWVPWDLTNAVCVMSFARAAGLNSIVASADIDVHSPVDGKMTVTVDGANFASVNGKNEIVTLAYDLKINNQVIVRGHAILVPGVS